MDLRHIERRTELARPWQATTCVAGAGRQHRRSADCDRADCASSRRIERYLVLAAEAGIDPVIVLSKADLCGKERLYEAIARTRESAPGVPVIPWSAVNGQDPGVIAGCVQKGQTAAVAGSSGAGKSTLINRLLGEERLKTREVRASDCGGGHTTGAGTDCAEPGGGWWRICLDCGSGVVGSGEAVEAAMSRAAGWKASAS